MHCFECGETPCICDDYVEGEEMTIDGEVSIRVDLEQECKTCEGHGKIYNGNKALTCQVCKGTRDVPTKFGENLLKFLDKNKTRWRK